MTIAIIGAGNVGLALGQALARRGERIRYGVTQPTKHSELPSQVAGAFVGATASAIEGAEIVILAVPYSAAAAVAQSVADWEGRILVDATNPIAPGLAGLSIGTTTSGAEEVAKQAHNARVVKAFNTTGAENMLTPAYPHGQVFMPVCGDDAEAREKIVALATLIGFEAVDLGALAAARYLEPFGMTWIHMAIKMGHGRRFGFGLLHR